MLGCKSGFATTLSSSLSQYYQWLKVRNRPFVAIPDILRDGRNVLETVIKQHYSECIAISDFNSANVVSTWKPAALAWPPPPNEQAIAATSTVPSERRLT